MLARGDITAFAGDAIVNAANERLLGGGGVDGAIHRAAGPELRACCEALPEVRPGVRCPTGEARITPGFGLRARWIIHTVGPVYRGPASAPLLRACHAGALRLCGEHRLRTVAFPAISCGAYGYPAEEAAPVALACVADVAPAGLDEVCFTLFEADTWQAFVAAAGRLFGAPGPALR
ncbi:MAG: macro domain-containing protein [Polyangiaceae bacterium]|nr:macro domain-containing protein [Polyangiaceae bacterium]